VDQGLAELVADPDHAEAFTLYVEGSPQSHVDVGDPARLHFEYIRLLGHVVDAMAPPGLPVNALHLGGGAWTLARYVAQTRPGSRQRVVELDAALVELVRRHLPSDRTGIRVRTGDAREVLTDLTGASVDLVVLDVFAGARTPAHLTSSEFYAQVLRVLRPHGSCAVNVADGGSLAFLRSQAATLSALLDTTVRTGGRGDTVALLGPRTVLRGRHFGNVVLLASRAPLPLPALGRRVASMAQPMHLLSGREVTDLVAGMTPVTDATSVDSPTR
jgi:hypothetical protein